MVILSPVPQLVLLAKIMPPCNTRENTSERIRPMLSLELKVHRTPTAPACTPQPLHLPCLLMVFDSHCRAFTPWGLFNHFFSLAAMCSTIQRYTDSNLFPFVLNCLGSSYFFLSSDHWLDLENLHFPSREDFITIPLTFAPFCVLLCFWGYETTRGTHDTQGAVHTEELNLVVHFVLHCFLNYS